MYTLSQPEGFGSSDTACATQLLRARQARSTGSEQSRGRAFRDRVKDAIAEIGEERSVRGFKTAAAANAIGVPVRLLQMILAIEDKRFWLHAGIDPIGVARALLMVSAGRGRLQGGSAIAEQLVKIRWAPLRCRTIVGRIVRASLGTVLTLTNTREELLRRYIETVYFGASFYGLQDATKGYFAMPPAEISAAHSFFLAERIALPNTFRPDRVRNVLKRQIVRAILSEDIAMLPTLYGMRFGPEAKRTMGQLVRQSWDAE